MASLQSTIVDGAIIHKEGTTPLAINPRTLRIDYSTGTSFEITLGQNIKVNIQRTAVSNVLPKGTISSI